MGARLLMILIVAIGSGVATGVLAERATPAPGASAGTEGQFQVRCLPTKRISDDPIVYPRQPGASHLHDFFGNPSTDAYSTLVSLRAVQGRCLNKGDRSAYWVPALYRHGRVVEPNVAVAYYRTAGRDPASIVPFPPGLRVIAGNSKAKEAQDPRVTSWGCTTAFFKRSDELAANRREAARRRALRLERGALARERRTIARLRRRGAPWRTLRRHERAARRHERAIGVLLRRGIAMPTCGPRGSLRATIRFPECWNGRTLDSPDHASHMAYGRYSRAARRMVCPRSHRVAVPKLVLHVGYASNGGKGFHLSSHGTQTMHADFFNAWDEQEMRERVRACLTADRHCGRG